MAEEEFVAEWFRYAFMDFDNLILNIDDYAESLTHLAIKTRYPNAIFIDEDITKTALAQANIIKNWAEKVMAEQKLSK